MSVMPGHEGEVIDLTEIVGEIEVPCDWDTIFRCGPRAATWVASVRCPCGHSSHRLICEGCKDSALVVEGGVMCPTLCGEVIVPMRRVITHIEPLGRA